MIVHSVIRHFVWISVSCAYRPTICRESVGQVSFNCVIFAVIRAAECAVHWHQINPARDSSLKAALTYSCLMKLAYIKRGYGNTQMYSVYMCLCMPRPSTDKHGNVEAILFDDLMRKIIPTALHTKTFELLFSITVSSSNVVVLPLSR